MRRRIVIAAVFVVAIGWYAFVYANVDHWGSFPENDGKRDAQLAKSLESVRPLVENGDYSEARRQIVTIVEMDEALSGKIERYRAQLTSVAEIPGSYAYRADLQAQVPSTSDDETRALYLLSILSLVLPLDDGCSFAPILYLAALNGHPQSQFQVGGLLGRGNVCGWPQDTVESVHWYIEAGKQGHVEAQVNHAMAMLLGQGTAMNQADAIDVLTRNATDSGNAKAQYLLGSLATEGYAVPKSESTAAKWFRMAADQGFAPAQTGLGKLLWAWANSVPEWDEAREWLRRAAEQGEAEGQYQLARAYASGIDGEFWRYGEAMKWLEAAATRGHLKAQTALGLKYWEGDIRTHTAPPDHQKSVEWLARAAARGDALAQTYLGYAYIEGKGVPQNDRTAIEWWQQAAQKNESRAEEALGWAYDKGRGVSADLREARRWYSRAKSHGSMGAAGKLNETRFESLAQQDKGLALFLGLLVLGIATAGDTDLPAANASQGCVTPFGTFAHSCDVASDIGWAGIQAGIW